MIAALLDGTVDCIATDHAPHAKHEKEVEFDRAPNGITGLETALGLAIRILHREHGMPLAKVIEFMSSHPSKLVKLRDAGSLKPGAWGDVVVFKADAEWKFEAAASLSKSKNTPFDGASMVGRMKATVVNGAVVFGGEP